MLTEGPGKELVAIFSEMGVPSCSACHDLAQKMNDLGPAGCRENIEQIVSDILPRATAWLQQSGGWVDKLKARAPDFAKKPVLRGYVEKAIERFEALPRITVAMAAYDDYYGVDLTVQTLRLFHPEMMPLVDILVVVAKTGTWHHHQTVKSCKAWGVRCIEYDGPGGTSHPRQFAIEQVQTEFTLFCDCHVQFLPGTLRGLHTFWRLNRQSDDLIMGPLVWEEFCEWDGEARKLMALGQNWAWGGDRAAKDPGKRYGRMIGQWRNWKQNPQGLVPTDAPLEIPLHGLGAFSFRTASWPGFSKHHEGFGGEEAYIARKYSKRGNRVILLPSFRWRHRWGREKIPYKSNVNQTYRNFLVGEAELGEDWGVYEHYREHKLVGPKVLESIREEVRQLFADRPAEPTLEQTMSKYQRQDAIVLGVGHSGTTILTRMMGKLGWHLNDADKDFAESVAVRAVNAKCVPDPFGKTKRTKGDFDEQAAMEAVIWMQCPFVIKDPRFVFTLNCWAKIWGGHPPLLVYVVKNLERVKASYRKRNEMYAPDGSEGMYGHTVEELAALAERQFELWPGPKVRISYEQIAAAARLFDPKRAEAA